MRELEYLAEKVKTQLNLSYDANSVEFLDGFIDRNKSNSSEDQGLINAVAAFLGQCVILNYGGQWQLDSDTGEMCIAFDERNKVFPLSKTTKRFENGPEDSIYSFFTVIPHVFNRDILTQPATTKPNVKLPMKNRWWKFW